MVNKTVTVHGIALRSCTLSSTKYDYVCKNAFITTRLGPNRQLNVWKSHLQYQTGPRPKPTVGMPEAHAVDDARGGSVSPKKGASSASPVKFNPKKPDTFVLKLGNDIGEGAPASTSLYVDNMFAALIVPVYDMRARGFNWASDFDNLAQYPLMQSKVEMGQVGVVGYYMVQQMYGNADCVFFSIDWAGVYN